KRRRREQRSNNQQKWPSIYAHSHASRFLDKPSSGAGSSLAEAMMPHLRRANQVRVVAERSQRQLGLFKRNEAAALRDHFANLFETHTLHDAASHHNPIWHKQIDQVGQAQPEIVRLASKRLLSQFVAAFCKLENFFGGKCFGPLTACAR